MGPLAASRKASLTSSAKVFFSTWTTRSTTDTVGVGTRRATPAGGQEGGREGQRDREEVRK